MPILKKKAAPAPVSIPSLRDVSRDYDALLEKQAEIRGKITALRDEIAELNSKIYSSPTVSSDEIEVASMLGDDLVDGGSALKAQRVAKLREVDVAEKALLVLDGRIQSANRAASVQVCDQVRPEYVERVRAVCAALVAVYEAESSLRELTDQLDRSGVTWNGNLRIMPSFSRDRYGPVARYLNEAAGFDMFERSAIPEAYR